MRSTLKLRKTFPYRFAARGSGGPPPAEKSDPGGFLQICADNVRSLYRALLHAIRGRQAGTGGLGGRPQLPARLRGVKSTLTLATAEGGPIGSTFRSKKCAGEDFRNAKIGWAKMLAPKARLLKPAHLALLPVLLINCAHNPNCLSHCAVGGSTEMSTSPDVVNGGMNATKGM